MAALEARELSVPDTIADLLIKLRLLTDTTKAPLLDLSAVTSLENALKCVLPEVVLALFANGDDQLFDWCGIDLEEAYDHTLEAHCKGLSKDLIVIGRHPDDHCYYCVPRQSKRDAVPGITVYENFDQSTGWHSLDEWLTQLIEECDFDERNPEVTDAMREEFRPALTNESGWSQ